MVGPRVSIVIPAFNEAATIELVVRQSAVFGTPIVVDDGSSDDTGSIASAAGAIVVKHEKNCGYDASLNIGLNYAAELDFDIVITIDADGQHDPQSIKQCLELIHEGADIVVGVRNKFQRFSEYVFASVTKIRYGLKDPLCGFKAYRISLYHALGHFDSYGSIGTELVLFGLRNNYTFRQIPIHVRERQDDPRFGQGLRANYKILRSLFRSFFKP
jgi:glycosyltransferase involved in cell wall biosynthesis